MNEKIKEFSSFFSNKDIMHDFFLAIMRASNYGLDFLKEKNLSVEDVANTNLEIKSSLKMRDPFIRERSQDAFKQFLTFSNKEKIDVMRSFLEETYVKFLPCTECETYKHKVVQISFDTYFTVCGETLGYKSFSYKESRLPDEVIFTQVIDDAADADELRIFGLDERTIQFLEFLEGETLEIVKLYTTIESYNEFSDQLKNHMKKIDQIFVDLSYQASFDSYDKFIKDCKENLISSTLCITPSRVLNVRNYFQSNEKEEITKLIKTGFETKEFFEFDAILIREAVLNVPPLHSIPNKISYRFITDTRSRADNSLNILRLFSRGTENEKLSPRFMNVKRYQPIDNDNNPLYTSRIWDFSKDGEKCRCFKCTKDYSRTIQYICPFLMDPEAVGGKDRRFITNPIPEHDEKLMQFLMAVFPKQLNVHFVYKL